MPWASNRARACGRAGPDGADGPAPGADDRPRVGTTAANGRTVWLVAVARALPAAAYHTVTWREGSKGKLTSRFGRVRVWPSHGYHEGKPPEGEQWLLIEWPANAAQPTKYWLATAPRRISLVQLVRWAKARWRVEQDYAQLKDELGLDHFEGRRWLGLHHHVTMTTMAYGFLIREQLRDRARGKKNGARPHDPAGPRGTPVSSENVDRILHRVRPTRSRHVQR